MRTSSSVAALIAGSLAVIGIGSVMLLAAGLFQTLDNRRGPAAR
jgi:hypothetical protein